MPRVTVVKADLELEPGVSIGPTSSSRIHANWPKEEAEKQPQCTPIPTASGMRKTETISTFPGPIGPCLQYQHAQRKRQGKVRGLAQGQIVLR